jgi:ATP-dependent Lhr-like helicase
MAADSLSYFHPLFRQWFSEKVGSPTDIQLKAWPEIARGRHVLVTAPTGSGKTLAAFLWGLNQLVTGAWPGGKVRVLYVSPLKALNNDVRKNLLKPLRELHEVFSREGATFPSITVSTRSGDTPGEERRRMVRKPPEILITTPESLNLLLSSHSGRTLLTGVATVILDEIHAVADTKRGTHLITAVDRLVPLSGEFQRIALSATVNPPERVAAFVAGFRKTGKGRDSHYEKRPVTIIRSRDVKAYELRVSRSAEAFEPAAGDSLWPLLAGTFKRIIEEHNSTLLFANSRRTAEKVTRLLNENEPAELAYAHHGSLSREIRLAVEEKLKNGELKAIVATNSLELGIDIGALDQVVLIQTPRSVSSALQRIGRSGHSVGEKSSGLLFPTHGMDFVDAAVSARAVLEQDIEEVRPVEEPLDVLAQVLLSMAAMERWDIDELYAFIRTSYPYRELPRKHFDLVIEMLAGRYADTRLRELKAHVSIDRMDNAIQARGEATFLLYSSGGTIPERGYFDLRLRDSRAKIGELDEEFVWERSIGETFTLGSQLWRIENITHNDVEVVPAQSATGVFPFWRAEEQSRDFHFSERIGLFLEEADDRLDSPGFRQELADRNAMDEGAAEELVRYLHRQKEATGTSLPHRRHLLVEHVEDPVGRPDARQVILHTLWGGKVNRPFGLALSAAWEDKERYPLQVISNDDALSLMLPHDFQAGDVFTLVTPENVEGLLRRKLEQTGFFGARFRENAERALLLPKSGFRRRMPLWLIRLRSKKLLEAVKGYEDFPILIETWRACLQDEFDLGSLTLLLDEVREGRIRVSECVTRAASPFASGLVWKQTNKYMYDDDTPLLAKESSLRPELIQEILFSSHLRPRIPTDLARALDQKLKRTAPGYGPGSAQDLLDWVKERMIIPELEWRELAEAIRRDSGEDPQAWLDVNAGKLAWVSWQVTRHPLLGSIEVLPSVLSAFRLKFDELSCLPVSAEMSQRDLLETVRGYLGKTSGEAPSLRPPFDSLMVVSKVEPSPLGGEDKREGGAREEYGLSDFLASWLAHYGPIARDRVKEILGIPEERLEEAVEPLIEARELVLDRFAEESTALEICDSGNLEMLLRMARRRRQPLFQALRVEQLPLFLASFQGIAARGASIDDLQQRLEQLFGWAAPAETWEENILPARMRPYRGEWLDTLMSTSDLVWFGCGKERISLAFGQDLELFRGPGSAEALAEAQDLDKLIPDRRGRYSLFEIAEMSRLDSARAAELLWKEAWNGRVTSDTFRTVRRGIVTNFTAQAVLAESRPLTRRAGFNRWKVSRPLEGHWRRIDGADAPRDVLAEEELNRDRIRQLLRRFGILFRELLLSEMPLLQWRGIFRSLRLMELSGEVLSGHFFEGIPGLQFVSHEAFRTLQESLPEDSVFWINAADPASLCGVPLEPLKPLLPPRVSSTHLVYHGSRLVMVSKRLGRGLDIRVGPDDPRLPEYLSLFKDLLTREFNPLQKSAVEEINGEPALKSPYAEALKRSGFRSSRTGLELWREY